MTNKFFVISGSGYAHSTASFLFSLKNKLNQQYKMFMYRHNEYAIYRHNGYGPTFGGGHDLHIGDCHKHWSVSDLGNTYRAPNGYVYRSKETETFLAGSSSFLCDEY